MAEERTKTLADVLLSPEGGSEILMGNWALVRAMAESGVRVVTSYPGSPTPEIGEAILSLPKDRSPFYFEWSLNEKVATEVAFGASLNGHLSCVFFKSVGLNVASDSFVQLSLMELTGGLVVVLGDDPGVNSSQNEQDNRHFAKLSYTPMLEPASPSEAYAMFKEAAALSRRKRMPVVLRMTTHVCHAKERVLLAPYTPAVPDDTPRFDKKNGPYIPIAAAVFPLKRAALRKLGEVREEAEASPLNRVDDEGNPSRGIITAGLPYLSLLDALEGARSRPDILKLAHVHPLPRRRIADFLRAHREVKVLEELDDVLELQVKAIAHDEGIGTRVIGKLDPEEGVGELVADRVEGILRAAWPDLLPAKERLPAPAAPPTPRPPQLCPGCGHRTVFHAVRRALQRTDITVADIGCHTLGHLPPHEVGEMLLCMGHSNGTAAGLSLFNRERRVVAFIGDSTLFHAGLPGIVNAVLNGHRHTLIVMENGTTAMTGHQDHAGKVVKIRPLLEALGVKSIRQVAAYREDKVMEALREALAEDGFSVIIATHPCMLKLTRESRRKGLPAQPPVSVTEKCDRRHVCNAEFACPSYQLAGDGSVSVHEDLCIGDRSCVQTCPTGAIAARQKPAGGAS